MSACPPSTTQQRSALVRSARKLSKILGDVPRVEDIPPPPTSESIWRKRKPTHLPPLLGSPKSPMYHHIPTHRSPPSTASASAFSSTHSDATQRRLKIEHLRRKLGNEVPTTAIFPLTPIPTPNTNTPTPRGRTRSQTRSRSRSVAPDDARSAAFSINSDERVHTVTLTAAHVHRDSPRSKPKHVSLTGPLPPVPPIPTHLVASSRRPDDDDDDDDAGLIRPRVKMAAGSRIGGEDFKAARRAKREGRARNGNGNGMAEPGELVEMVGFLRW